MFDLPTDLPWFGAWRKEVRKRIDSANATGDLNALRVAGCGEDQLLFRLAAVVFWKGKDPSRKATGLTAHAVKTAPKKLRDAAKLIQRLESWNLPADEHSDGARLIDALNSYVDRLEWIIKMLLHPPRVTLEIVALCCLVAYVEQATGRNHDKELSPLIAAVLGSENYYATHLTQWRSKHKQQIKEFRSSVVVPLGQPIP